MKIHSFAVSDSYPVTDLFDKVVFPYEKSCRIETSIERVLGEDPRISSEADHRRIPNPKGNRLQSEAAALQIGNHFVEGPDPPVAG
jgi:hypothetical protein